MPAKNHAGLHSSDQLLTRHLPLLQLLLTITLSYQLLYASTSALPLLEREAIVLVLLIFTIGVFLTKSLVEAAWYLPGLVASDTTLTAVSLYGGGQIQDSMVISIYSFVVLIAGLSRTLSGTIVLSLIPCSAYVAYLALRSDAVSEADMLGIPVIVALATFYGTAVQSNVQQRQRNRELSEELRQAQKLEALGRLASGIAHEVNTPLGYIKSNLEVLHHYADDIAGRIETRRAVAVGAVHNEPTATTGGMSDDEKEIMLSTDIRNLVDETLSGVETIRTLIQNLKNYAHPNRESQWCDVNTLMQSALVLVRHELKYHAKVQEQYQGIPPVYVVPTDLVQVFMNILVNAAQSIPEEGRIDIRTWADANHVFVEIQDTGCGIPPDHLRRIFDPFFTTKPVGEGTGLGLSICYNIITRYRGRIDVMSKVGEGSRFRITLPLQGPSDSKES